jgi:hypothetical protein
MNPIGKKKPTTFHYKQVKDMQTYQENKILIKTI